MDNPAPLVMTHLAFSCYARSMQIHTGNMICTFVVTLSLNERNIYDEAGRNGRAVGSITIDETT
jgi:hypothetical protein